MKKFITVVIEAPNDEYYKILSIGSSFYGGRIVAMGLGDEMTKLDTLERWIIQNHHFSDHIMSIINAR